jgi:competence protein ComEC
VDRPLLLAAIACAIGGAVSPLGTAAACGAVGGALIFARVCPAAAIVLGVFGAASLSGTVRAPAAGDEAAAPGTPFVGTVRGVRLAGPAVYVVVHPDGRPGEGVRVRLERRPAGVGPGARVRVEGPIRRPAVRDDPGVPDLRAMADARGVHWVGPRVLRLLEPGAPSARRPVELREAARRALDASGSSAGAGILKGLLLGDRRAVPAHARQALEASGTAHLMAVSGLHVGGLCAAIVGLVLLVGRAIPVAYPERAAAALALPAALAFVALAQFPVSACRAGLMMAAALVGYAGGRALDGLNLLGLAALVVLLHDPTAATEVGFQLSFGAVAALLLCARAGRGPVAMLVAACVASAATAPIQAWHFGTWAPIAPVANLVLVPIAATVLVPASAVALAVAPLSPTPLAWAAEAATLLTCAAEVMAGWGGGARVVGRAYALLLATPIAVVLAAFAVRAAPAGRRIRVAVPGGLICASLLAVGIPADAPRARVHFLPVGQGDAILVESAGAAALVDAGPDPNAWVLRGALRALGIGAIDVAILSHPHPDHYRGFEGVVAEVPIRRFLYNGRAGHGDWWRQLERALGRHGIAMERARAGPLPLGRARLVVGPVDAPPDWGENDASLWVRVDGPGGAVLLSGDLEARGEARWVAQAAGVPSPLVLKSAHHGSRTSSGPAFLDAVCPAAVVHTVGRENRYGFPHSEVSARLRARGIPTWRTDRDGRITVDLGGTRPTIEAFYRPGPVPVPARRCG